MVKQLLSLIILFHSVSLVAESPEEAERKFKFAQQDRNAHSSRHKMNPKLTPEFIKLLMAAAPQKLKEAIQKAKDPNCPYDLRVSRVLLHGVPGNGKTTLAEVLAHEMGLNFVHINSSLLGTEYVNSAAQNLMRKIEPNLDRPCLILLDEADALFREPKGPHESAQVAQQAWQVLDELAKLPHVIVIGTTNDIKSMPVQLQSRFSKHIIEVPNADLPTKKEIVKFYLKDSLHECDDTFLTAFVNKCKELSARDIENVVYGARDTAYHRNPTAMRVTKKDLEDSLADLFKNKRAMKKKQKGGGTNYWMIYRIASTSYNVGKFIACKTKDIGCEWPSM